MEAEDVGMDEMWQCLDVIKILLMCVEFRHFKDVLWSKFVSLIIEHLIIKVVIKQCNNQPSIFIISNSSTIITLCNQILQSRERYFLILIQKHLNLPD